MVKINGIKEDPSTDLDIYLVENKLKPAAIVNFFPYNGIPLDNRDLQSAKDYLDTKDVSYVFKKRLGLQEGTTLFNPFASSNHKYSFFYFTLGSSRKNLRQLNSSRTTLECGVALGYPLEEIKLFEKGARFYSYVARLIDAKKQGIEIPSWLAYISFVPSSVNLVNGDILPETKELAMKYQDFTRRNNLPLATRVEEGFRKMCGSYVDYWLDEKSEICLLGKTSSNDNSTTFD